MTMRPASIACLLYWLAVPASAFTGALSDNAVVDTRPQPHAAPGLPELAGVVSWKTLAEVQTMQENDRIVPQFPASIAALDRHAVKFQGFMLPTEPGATHKHFILSATTPTCAFCIPGGPDSLIDVDAKVAIPYGAGPIVISGQFTLLHDDPAGIFYRVTDAVLAKP